MIQVPSLARRAVAPLLFLAVAAVGVALHRDYGVPWDEPTQRQYAQLVAQYVFGGGDRLFDDMLRHYGPAYEMVLLAAETVFAARDMPDVWAVRHLVNVLVFAAGCVCLYWLALAGTGSRLVGVVASVALVLSPRVFADAFYNSKDVPFLVAFVAAAATLLRFLDRPRAATIAAHALASAWLIAIRIPGVLMPALTVGLAVYGAVRAPAPPSRGRRLASLAIYLAATAALTVAFWPTLWRNPIGNFLAALETMSRYPWPGDVLYAGRFVSAADLPWHYGPVWMAISTPLLYLAGFCVGFPALLDSVRRELTGPVSRRGLYSLLVLAWLAGPLGAVVLFGSVLYDGWRQLYFVYPALLLVAAEGGVRAGRAAWRHRDRPALRAAGAVAALAVVVAAGGILRFTIAAHPHQQVFFNALVGGPAGARFRYEMDYWGLSYRQGLEAVLRLDDAPLIPVAVADPPGEWYGAIVPHRDRRRLVFVDTPDQAKYFVGAYRSRQDEYPFPDVVHREHVGGATILTVARVDAARAITPASIPAVAAMRSRNEAAMADLDDAGVLPAVHRAVIDAISHYVRDAARLDVEVRGAVPDLRAGRLDDVRVLVEGGAVGDFRRGRPGVPVERIDVALGGVLIDLARPAGEGVRLVGVERVTVADLAVDGAALTEALGGGRGEGARLRVGTDGDAVRIERSGRPRVEAAVRLRVGPDPWRLGSDNLFVEVAALRVAGWRLPIAGLVQAAARTVLSPVIGPDALDATIVLGALRVDGPRIRLGTSVAP